ncbi:hypothetical protein [Staphylococcus haemolyticus]|uniref:hypothetical protein n=1 Tax=Staphylococcus haemolyticus TaxID=1283 RepID=UPI001E17792C|nr:hypothetical protein [Staphylococcus haemolyticus]MBM6371504.1 hypothetical protein [Staphylococcus epidermidis]MCH4446452.1 hypothetical protein [Staphylococcus haemolyticus]
MEKPKIRINNDTLDKLKTLKEEKNLKTFASVIEYLLEQEQNISNKNSNDNLDVNDKLNKILAGTNYNSKILSLLEEFSNTVAVGLAFDENKSTMSDPSNWHQQAKKEVENKIQTNRTQSLSHSKEDYNE